MMKKYILIGLTISLYFTADAQVINTERLRVQKKTKALMGSVDASFGLSRTKAGQTLNLNFDSQFNYTKGRSKWMFVGGYNRRTFSKVNVLGDDFVVFNNFQYVHLRYNYQLNDRWTWEIFAQEQVDEIHEIDFRGLTGTGARWQILQTDTSQLYLGALYMYEYEKTSPEDSIVYNLDHRMSCYLSGGFKIKDYLTINNIVYYQPNLGAFSDFRVLLETRISTRLTQRLVFNTRLDLIFDSLPPETVPTLRYSLTSGFGWVF